MRLWKILTFAQIFGCQYFSLKHFLANPKNEAISFQHKMYFAVFLTLVTLLSLMSVVSMKEDFASVELNATTVVSFVIQYLFQAGLVSIGLVSSVQSFMTTSLTKQLYLNFIEIARIFQQYFQQSPDHFQVRRKALKMIYIGSAFIAISNGLLSLIVKKRNVARGIFTSAMLIYEMVGITKLVYFYSMVHYHLSYLSICIDETFSQNLSYGSKRIFIVKAVKQNKIFTTSFKIRKLRAIYNIILENCDIINKSIGTTVLVIFIVLSIVMTAFCYKYFLIIVGRLPKDQLMGEIELICGSSRCHYPIYKLQLSLMHFF
jgi:hypothetical protein